MKGSSKGKSFNDRELAGQVRNLALGHLFKVLQPDYEDKQYQKDMLLKLASNLLPRLNEHTGADGEPLVLPATLIDKNDTASIPRESSPEQTQV